MRRLFVSVVVLVGVSVAIPAEAEAGNPVGDFDSLSIATASGFERPEQNDSLLAYVAYGWAADPDAGQHPIFIHLYVDGQMVQQTQTGEMERRDVERVHPWAGPNSGFAGSVTFPADSRPHQICAYAINAESGETNPGATNTTLGCKTVSPTSQDGYEPVTHLDGIDVAPGLIHVRGWAGEREVIRDPADPSPESRAPTHVKVYYDGRPMGHIPADAMREDVQRAHPELGRFTGISDLLPIPPGRHHVCVYALNGGLRGLQNTTVGCAVVDVPGEGPRATGEPEGSLDAIEHEGSGPNQPFFTTTYARGWAYDPNADTTVLVRAFTYADHGKWRYAEVTAPTDQRRADVAAARPEAGFETGFRDQLGGGKYHHWVQVACAYVWDMPGQSRLRFIGCRSD